MRGEIVFVRDAWGQPLVRRVWEATPTTVYICNEERYQRLLKDYASELPPTAFPIENVYVYDPSLEKTLRARWQTDPSVWKSLTQYRKRLGENDSTAQGQRKEDDQRKASFSSAD